MNIRRCATEHGNAGALSRVPLGDIPAQTNTLTELVLLMEHLADSHITAKQIQTWTRRDPTLSTVFARLAVWVAMHGTLKISSYFKCTKVSKAKALKFQKQKH